MLAEKDKIIRDEDPLKRMVEKESGGQEFSPMDPPEAFDASGLEDIDHEKFHPCLKTLMKEHEEVQGYLSEFEDAVITLKENGMPWDKKVQKKISDFFASFDQTVLPHNHKEEKYLFTILNRKLKMAGVHASAESKHTAVDMMEDDHIKFVQISSLVLNLLELCVRLPDPGSRLMVLDIAIEQSAALIELMKLHLFREDNIVFPLAQKYLSTRELDQVNEDMAG
jgi:hemerythrin-like domain-containing protein